MGPTAAAPVPTQSAALDKPVALGTGATVSLSTIETISVEAKLPGETAGPAVRVTVAVKNEGDEPLDVNSAVVTLSADDGGYGVGTTAGDPDPLQGSVEPGSTVMGTYVFMLDPAKDREVTISVNYAAGDPLAVFTGRTA